MDNQMLAELDIAHHQLEHDIHFQKWHQCL